MSRSNGGFAYNPPPHRVRAFAPGGIGNLGPGVDIIGCAVSGLGDRVDARISDRPGIELESAGHDDLPRDASRNAASIAAGEVLRRSSDAHAGIVLRVIKGLPLAGGQGGSAASAVAGAVLIVLEERRYHSTIHADLGVSPSGGALVLSGAF